ncbi:putative nuclease HARBI1 [Gigantopelta aegis]|uniref:putative nuclease HARBI1 n=1 Tax=Gigantopelta aegis TaxID=1735272 RepID=UPI001B88C48E|nr:putative nuclease HARBI1 [Gigantopelta aegis]
MFINCIAKWPGSFHDSGILRESSLFSAFEDKDRRPLKGIILGDSGYMLREWLFTPLVNPVTCKERSYNFYHSSACTAVEQAIGVLKRRWHCLRRLRLEPAKACKVITVCIMLHNYDRKLKLEDPTDSDSDSECDSSSQNTHFDVEEVKHAKNPVSERARFAAGKAARCQLINYF